jgi:hypothetical protein
VNVLGTAPIVTTLPVTDAQYSSGTAIATLRGELNTLNGMPRVDVWFVWGYDASMGNTTPSVSVVATGTQTVVISGYNSNRIVYYQFRSSTDSVAYGTTENFHVGGGVAGWLLLNLITLLLSVGVTFVSLMAIKSGNWVATLILIIIGIIGIVIVRGMIVSIV